jgi:hypothetical protein
MPERNRLMPVKKTERKIGPLNSRIVVDRT